MDLKTDLSENQAVLLLMDDVKYNAVIVDTLKNLKGSSVCYVTSNKTYDALKELFKKNNVDVKDVVFIDSISKLLKGTPPPTDNCYYVSSPGALPILLSEFAFFQKFIKNSKKLKKKK